jgi:hypothetical protein
LDLKLGIGPKAGTAYLEREEEGGGERDRDRGEGEIER